MADFRQANFETYVNLSAVKRYTTNSKYHHFDIQGDFANGDSFY